MKCHVYAGHRNVPEIVPYTASSNRAGASSFAMVRPKYWTGLQPSDVLWRGFWDSGYILIYCNIAASSLAYIICMTAKDAAQCLMESADISVKP